jgi:hypothetical protein
MVPFALIVFRQAQQFVADRATNQKGLHDPHKRALGEEHGSSWRRDQSTTDRRPS